MVHNTSITSTTKEDEVGGLLLAHSQPGLQSKSQLAQHELQCETRSQMKPKGKLKIKLKVKLQQKTICLDFKKTQRQCRQSLLVLHENLANLVCLALISITRNMEKPFFLKTVPIMIRNPIQSFLNVKLMYLTSHLLSSRDKTQSTTKIRLYVPLQTCLLGDISMLTTLSFT